MFSKCDCKKIHIRGEKTDIWALGVTLFFLISGRTPFDSATNPFELKAQIVDQDINFNLVTFEPVRALLQKMLKKEPNERISLISILQEDPWVTNNGKCIINVVDTEQHDDNFGNINRLRNRPRKTVK